MTSTHKFFCRELVCENEAPVAGGRCYSCRKMDTLRDLAERFYLGECYAEHDEGYKAARAWYLGELGEPPTLQQAYDLGKKLLRWYELDETLSHETNECPGCGVSMGDVGSSANGYCAACWQQRYGCEEEHVCNGEYVDHGFCEYLRCDDTEYHSK